MTPSSSGSDGRHVVTRRRFIKLVGFGTAVAGALTGVRIKHRRKLNGGALAAELPASARAYRPPVMAAITLNVNGTDHSLTIDTRASLAEVLRNNLTLTGTHVSCDRGECGACTVVMDGQSVYSCSLLAVQAQGRKILTIEGLTRDGKLDPIQEAFIAKDAYQCGFCTSGQVMALKALFLDHRKPTAAEIRRAVSGNICRCGAYQGIIDAGLAVAGKQ